MVSHLAPSHRVAAGLKLPPSVNGPFAAAQAAWRFYSNERVSLRQLSGPLIDCARAGVACADCHMPYTRVGAAKISEHHIQSPLLMINRSCQVCHPERR